MSVIGSNILAGASGQGGGYNLTNSLRFRSSASAYLSRTQTSGNTQKFTLSAWAKDAGGTFHSIYSAQTGTSSNYLRIGNSGGVSNGLQFGHYDPSNGGTIFEAYTNASYRDPSAWYHFILAVDTTQATDTNRIKIYCNGSQVTLSGTYPTQNANLNINANGVVAQLGGWTSVGQNWNGYLTEVNFIDGQALTPSSFGETSATTGVWQPKKYTGTYGTNGFYLPFTDNSALTSGSNAGLGKDFSGNGNYWTTNNISITSGITYDSMTDVPTLTSATASNFCTWNPLRPSSYGACAIADGNLKASQSASAYVSAISTFAMPSGKWYWEITCSSIGFVTSIGITNTVTANGAGASGAYSYHYDGSKYVNGSNSSYGASYTSGDVLGFAYDADAGSLTCYKNGTSQGVLASGLTPTDFYIWATLYGTWNIALNCGQRPFTYTPPTGYVALNTFNI